MPIIAETGPQSKADEEPTIIFDEERVMRSPTPVSARKPIRIKKRYAKWLLYATIAVVLYFSINWLRHLVLYLLQLSPAVWSIYQAVEAEIAAKSLLGLFYATTAGALFFMPNPLEAVYLYYLGQTNYFFIQIMAIALFGYLIGMSLDYFFGWLTGPRILKWMLKKRYDSFHRRMERMGGFIVVLFHIIPLFPTGPFMLFLGGIRYGYYRSLLYMALGKTIMLVLFFLGHQYFTEHLAAYMETFSFPFSFESLRAGFGG